MCACARVLFVYTTIVSGDGEVMRRDATRERCKQTEQHGRDRVREGNGKWGRERAEEGRHNSSREEFFREQKW